MPYVVRDKNGSVVSVIATPNPVDEQRVGAGESDIKAYFDKEKATRDLQEVLVASDLSFVRVLEDLISALLDRGVILLTDLPEAAQAKILERKDIRQSIANLGALIDDVTEEDELMI